MKALEESELETEIDGRSLQGDMESRCSSVRNPDSPLTARLVPLIANMLWIALAAMEQTRAAGGKGVQVVPAAG